ncbi:MAG: hypothetical protein JSR90_24410 [Proteobacteria bacterium]|nr:hypothetical protein [Pseudomonadota bacterium]
MTPPFNPGEHGGESRDGGFMGEMRLALAGAAAIALAACSPYRYSTEVGKFSTSVDTLASAFTSGYDAPTSDRTAALQIQLIDERAPVVLSPGCALRPGRLPDSKAPCAVLRATAPVPPPIRIPDTPTANEIDLAATRDDTMKALKVLKDYAKGLAAVTNAADRAAYDAAVAQLASAVGALTSAAAKGMPGAGTVATASVNLLGWLVGEALDQQRYDTLRSAVLTVDTPLPEEGSSRDGSRSGAAAARADAPPPTDAERKAEQQRAAARKPIHIVATTFGKGLLAVSVARQEWLYEEGRVLAYRLNAGLSTADYRQRLADTQAVVAAINGLRNADPTGTAQDMAKAHDALAAALRNPKTAYADLLAAIGTFADKVAAVQSALAAAGPSATKKGS